LRAELAASFEVAGFSVVEAKNGQVRLFSATENPLDIALINLALPVLSGLHVLPQLRACTGFCDEIMSGRDRNSRARRFAGGQPRGTENKLAVARPAVASPLE
jgi:DNA-binding response OmpR family regulator